MVGRDAGIVLRPRGTQGIERWGPYVTYGQLLMDMNYTLEMVNGGALPSGGAGIFDKFLSSALDFLGLSGAQRKEY